MKTLSIFGSILIICLAAQGSFGQEQRDREQATFLRNAKLLEAKPFDPNAAGARSAAFKWVIDTDQVTVGVCSSMMNLIPEKKNKFKSELFMQQTLGMAVFKLEAPDKKPDEKAAQLAGVESMLRTYETMVGIDEKAKNPKLDDLLAKQKSGELKALVDAAFDAGKCGVRSPK